jgi:hypothetical protein
MYWTVVDGKITAGAERRRPSREHRLLAVMIVSLRAADWSVMESYCLQQQQQLLKTYTKPRRIAAADVSEIFTRYGTFHLTVIFNSAFFAVL